MRKFSLFTWENCFHDQHVYLSCAIEIHQELYEVNFDRLLEEKWIKVLLNWLTSSSCSLKLISSILTGNTFCHTRWNILMWGLIIHLYICSRLIIILLRIVMHQLLPLFKVLLHLTYLHQLAHIYKLLYDFLVLLSNLLFIFRKPILWTFINAFQMFSLYLYSIIIQIWKPI